MADLITTVRQEIAELRKTIVNHEEQLQALKGDLRLHEKIAGMLEGGTADSRTIPRPSSKQPVSAAPKLVTKKKAQAKKQAPVKKKPAKRTDWAAILEKLPQSFSVAQVKEVAGKASTDADVHQALLRWRKAGSVTTNGRGQYGKARRA